MLELADMGIVYDTTYIQEGKGKRECERKEKEKCYRLKKALRDTSISQPSVRSGSRK